jgi:MtrB/PioB family decaheme-associated outer membrane protein
MKPTRVTGVFLAAGFVLGLAGGAAAQTKVGGMNLEGDIEAGVRFFIQEPSKNEKQKFEEYRDMGQGLFLQGLHLRYFTSDERYSTEFRGSKWGREDQEFSLNTGRTGLWRFEFDWDQTPHVFSTTARTLAHEVSRGDWRLPGLTSLRDFNSAKELPEVSVRWDTARIGFTLTPTPDLDLTAQYTRIHKDGDRPFSMSFSSPFSGANFIEILEPVEQTIHELRLGGTYARENWQIQFFYTLSIFQNELNHVTFDNPCFQAPVGGSAFVFGCPATESRTAVANVVPARGESSLPPSNMAHTLNIAGGVSLPLRTRLTASVGYSLWLQDQSFLPMTINPTVNGSPALALPQNSLDGSVSTTLLNVGLNSRPLPLPLTLSAKYRMYNLTDNSDVMTFPSRVVSDRPLAGLTFSGPVRDERLSFTRHNFETDARYRIVQPLQTTLGFGWERWNRGPHRQAHESDEFFAKAAADATLSDWLTAHLTYKPSFRRTDYNNHIGDFPFFTRQFDQADRDRQRVDFLLEFMPVDTLVISPAASWIHDDYIHSNFGINWETIWSAGIDVAWNPTDRLSFSAGYMHEITDRNLTSRATAALVNTDFVSNMADRTDSFYLNGKVGLIRNVLDWTFSAYYAISDGTVVTRNPNALVGGPPLAAGSLAQRFPDFVDDIVRVDTSLRYYFAKSWTARFFYAFEKFSKTDWRTDTLQPFNESLIGTTGSIYLGTDAKDYTSHIVGVTLSYKFE